MSLNAVHRIINRDLDLELGEERAVMSVSTEAKLTDVAARALIDALKAQAAERGYSFVEGPEVLRESMRIDGVQGYRVTVYAIVVPDPAAIAGAIQILEAEATGE